MSIYTGAASSRGGAQLLQQPDQLPRVNLTAGAPEDLSAWQGIKQWVRLRSRIKFRLRCAKGCVGCNIHDIIANEDICMSLRG